MYYMPEDGPSVTIGMGPKDYGKPWFTFHKNGETHSGEHLANELTGILLEFTDKKDKNGKEIYDGDVFESSFPGRPDIPNCRYQIEWGHAGFTAKRLGESLSNAEHLHPVWWNRQAKIIGNIHENPELR